MTKPKLFKHTIGDITFWYLADQDNGFELKKVKLTKEAVWAAQSMVAIQTVRYVHECYPNGTKPIEADRDEFFDGSYVILKFLVDGKMDRTYHWDVTELLEELYYDKWDDPEYKDEDFPDDVNKLMHNLNDVFKYGVTIEECLDADRDMLENAR